MKMNRIPILLLGVIAFVSSADHVSAGPPYQLKEKEELQQRAKEAKEAAEKEQIEYREKNAGEAWESYLTKDYEFGLRPQLRNETRGNILRSGNTQLSQLTREQRSALEEQIDVVWKYPNHERWRYNRQRLDFNQKKEKLIQDVAQATEKLALDGVSYEEAYKKAEGEVYAKRDKLRQQAKERSLGPTRRGEALRQHIERIGIEEYKREQKERAEREARNKRRVEQKERQIQQLPNTPAKYSESATQTAIEEEEKKLSNIYESAASALRL